ncbi:MAG: hypothetical protein KTR35_16570 [Gammaproteobacteria bacterium]|nr:hypothetical protein [Gammaproteobacteria bacterium]
MPRMLNMRGANTGTRRLLHLVLIFFLAVTSVSCGGGGGDEGGIIGTGVTLNGTHSSRLALASNQMSVKAKSGEVSVAEIGSNGLFEATSVEGQSPYLMRVDQGNSTFMYAIAHTADEDATRQNIHSYSDVAIRNWFAANGLNIDSVFSSAGAIAELPTLAEMNAINARIGNIIEDVLQSYELAGTDLARANYAANNTGIDLFLKQNPVLIQDGTIKIIVIDPETNTQTEAASGVPLNTDLSAEDTQVPSAPGSVRALPSALDEIVVVWDASIDNIGVSRYQVFRDGQLVETTPYPVFLDSPLQPDTSYTYSIVAVDAADNESAASPAVMAETLGSVDSEAPPAPTGITLIPSVNSVAISWLQTEIGDVAGFEVFRTDSEGTSAIAKVTSNFMTDAGVMSGTEYCYQVISSDAAGNESSLSPVSCVLTLGDTVVTDTDTDTETPPDTSTGDLTAPLVDVSGVSCEGSLDFSAVSDAVTVPSGCYETGSLTVQAGGSLTLSPGVILKFTSNSRLNVSSGGSLNANGTAEAPIVLTGVEATNGYWDGLFFLNSNSINNVLDHVLIEYAGDTQARFGALSVVSNSSNVSRVSISNSTVRHSLDLGFAIEQYSVIENFSRNIFTNNGRPGELHVNVIGVLDSEGIYSGNEQDAISVTSGTLSDDATWQKLDVPYRSEGLSVTANWALEPGVRIEFSANRGVTIGQDGSLNAVGDVNNPIVFTGAESTPGYWHGIRFSYSNSNLNELVHTVIEYGGSQSSFGGNLYLQANSSLPARVAVNFVTLSHSLNYGFVFERYSVLTTFENVTSFANNWTAEVHPTMASSIGAGSMFSGNSFDQIMVTSGSIDADSLWLTHDVPYFIESLNVDDDLTLSPGTTIIVESGEEILVTSDGSLNAVGTASQPITFTGEQASPGDWDGIRFSYSGNTRNVLSHTIVEYGGLSGQPSTAGNIEALCNSSSPTVLSIDNTMSNFSGGWGLYADDEDCQITVGSNVSFTGNSEGGYNVAP